MPPNKRQRQSTKSNDSSDKIVRLKSPISSKQAIRQKKLSSSSFSSVSSSSSTSSQSSFSSSSSSDVESDDDNHTINNKSKNNKIKKTAQNKQVLSNDSTKKTTKAGLFYPSSHNIQHNIPFLDKDQQKVAQYLLIREMRLNPKGVAYNAPVDTMGCSQVGRRDLHPKIFRWETLVALMLSSQTKDEVTANAIETLRDRLPNGLTPQSVIDNAELAHECIKKVGFHNTKIKSIINAATVCIQEYDGDIPPTYEELLKLPGVGPKMAHLTMSAAWNNISGIGVDVHVHRITNMLGWFNNDGPTKNPESTRVHLEKMLPKQYWNEINFLLVGFGQTICPSQRPQCDKCLLSQNLLCQRDINLKSNIQNLQRDIEDLINDTNKMDKIMEEHKKNKKIASQNDKNDKNNTSKDSCNTKTNTVGSSIDTYDNDSLNHIASKYILQNRLIQSGVTLDEIKKFPTAEPLHSNGELTEYGKQKYNKK